MHLADPEDNVGVGLPRLAGLLGRAHADAGVLDRSAIRVLHVDQHDAAAFRRHLDVGELLSRRDLERPMHGLAVRSVRDQPDLARLDVAQSELAVCIGLHASAARDPRVRRIQGDLVLDMRKLVGAEVAPRWTRGWLRRGVDATALDRRAVLVDDPPDDAAHPDQCHPHRPVLELDLGLALGEVSLGTRADAVRSGPEAGHAELAVLVRLGGTVAVLVATVSEAATIATGADRSALDRLRLVIHDGSDQHFAAPQLHDHALAGLAELQLGLFVETDVTPAGHHQVRTATG